MNEYYTKQVYLPHFLSYNRQRGSGFGPLAARIGRVALPFAKKFYYQQESHLEKKCSNEVLDVITSRKSPRQVAKKSSIKDNQEADWWTKEACTKKDPKTPYSITKRKRKQRSQSDFFSK